MKKLESLKNEKFVVTQDELLQVKGGYGIDVTYTYRQTTTQASNGTSSSDKELYDAIYQ